MESLADRAKKILKDAKAIELVFLVPDENYGPPNKEPGAEYLDWWKVTGRVPLDETKLQEIAGRLSSDLEANWRDGLADCFEPRHGLRVITDEGSFDLVLCFHCTQIWCFDESGTRLQSQAGISRDLQPILDALKTRLLVVGEVDRAQVMGDRQHRPRLYA